MTFTDRADAMVVAARLSWRDFLAVYPPRVYFLTTVPRSVLQVAFFTLVGYYAAGDSGRKFALIGACAHVIVLATVVRAPDVLIDERVMRTLHRLRLGLVPLPAIVIARWWVYICAGFLDALIAAVVVGAFVGELELVPDILAAAPLFFLLAFSTSGLGLLVAAISLTHRIDVLLTNLAAYVMLVFCGVVAPISVFGDFGEQLVRLLPLTNGLLAVRASIADEPWLAYAVFEMFIGLTWAALAVVLMQIQAERSRRRGTDVLL